MKRDAKYAEGVIARKDERARARKVKELETKGIVIPPDSNLHPIPDPDVIWKDNGPTWKAEVARRHLRQVPGGFRGLVTRVRVMT